MGYLHINNLYKVQTILMFREAYALEKIHGTSAHVVFKPTWVQDGDKPKELKVSLVFFSGGESHSRFVSLFDQEALAAAFLKLAIVDRDVFIYGEAYGGSQQGMSATYGKELKFVAFDVQIGDTWLSVPDAELIVKGLGLEFVHYTKVPLVRVKGVAYAELPPRLEYITETDLTFVDAERDAPSMQALRNGVITQEQYDRGEGPKREGIVMRPLREMTLNNGDRVIVKHKRDEFRETASPRVVEDPAKLKVLEDAKSVAQEWVTLERLKHVLDKLPTPHDMALVPKLIPAMQEDVLREGAGEIVDSKEVRKAIGTKAVELFKAFLNSKIGA
jgi:hypothetical protein